MKLFSKAATLGTTAILTTLIGASGALAQVDSITVTAQKREQTLQEVPISVAVVTAESIEQSTIRDAADLQTLVPSLRVAEFASSTNTEFALRGLGTSSFNPGLEPSVGIFVDGVYRPRSGAAINDLVSIERVEVLRGPQSTLFGRNTPAGVVSFITQEPQFDTGFEAAFTMGNYNTRILSASGTGALTDDIAVRLDVTTNEADGFLVNYDGREINNRDRQVVRGQVLWTPSDDMTVRIIADSSELNENCCAAPFASYDPADLGAMALLGATILPANPHAGLLAANGRVNTGLTNSGLSAEVNWDFDGFTLTSITSQRTYDEDQDIDADFSTLDLAQRRRIQQTYDSFTQEIRLTSTGGGDIDWMMGGFYYDNDLQFRNNTPLGSDIRPFFDLATTGLMAPITGGLGLPPMGFPTFLELMINANNGGALPLGTLVSLTGASPFPTVPTEGYLANGSGLVEEFYDYQTESTSFFATMDWHLSDRTTFTVGGRWSTEEKTMTPTVNIDDAISAIDYVSLAQDLRLVSAGTCLNPAIPDTCAYLVPAILAGGGMLIDPTMPLPLALAQDPAANFLIPFGAAVSLNPPLPAGGFPGGSRTDDNFSYNMILAHDWNDYLNTYVSYSTGFKPGGFNLSANAAFTGIFEFEEENTTSIEIGAKGVTPDGAIQYSIAYFEQNVEDFQSNNFVGSGFALQNAGEIQVNGIEFEANWAILDNWDVTGGFTALTENKYVEFFGAPCPDVAVATCYTGFPIIDSAGTTDPTRPFGTYNNLSNVSRGNAEFVSSVTSTYTHSLGDSMEMQWRAEAFHTAGYGLVTGRDERAVGNQDAFTLYNASIALADIDGGWELRAWGRNIMDEDFVKGGFPSVGLPGTSFNQYPGDPQTYGLTLRIRR
ncbi:MAG: TonB-dependent receptor [Maricaulis sp.]|jgi:outer membrane receptor protein involved in Fe transport|nr:TonB-dependent receptor [Maricaulis sp.]